MAFVLIQHLSTIFMLLRSRTGNDFSHYKRSTVMRRIRRRKQIFATDIDAKSVAVARAGAYSERIIEDVSQTRLRRFFVKVTGGYQVSRVVRDMCLFAVQNLTKDPPFSRLDLVCCHNLLIYLGPVLQTHVLQVFLWPARGHRQWGHGYPPVQG